MSRFFGHALRLFVGVIFLVLAFLVVTLFVIGAVHVYDFAAGFTSDDFRMGVRLFFRALFLIVITGMVGSIAWSTGTEIIDWYQTRRNR